MRDEWPKQIRLSEANVELFQPLSTPAAELPSKAPAQLGWLT